MEMQERDGSKPLAGRTALITGASAGIGEAVAWELAGQGAAVALNARRGEKLKALAAKITDAGGAALALPGDAADAAFVEQLAAEAIGWRGSLDIVVVNAGRGLAGGLMSSDAARWDAMYALNVLGAARLMRAAGKHMVERKKGDIVVLGSVSGHNVSPFSGFYGSTKFAITAAAEGMRREVCSSGVRVSTVMPGVVLSEFQAVAGYTEENFTKGIQRFGPLLKPDDVARAVAFIVAQPSHVHINELVIRPTGQDYP
jgi:NADP-dependent 3-hydroxy acid dehydrogenase YdfG